MHFCGPDLKKAKCEKVLQVVCIILYICNIHFSVLELSAYLTENTTTMVTMPTGAWSTPSFDSHVFLDVWEIKRSAPHFKSLNEKRTRVHGLREA